MEKQIQYGYSGVSYLATGGIGQSHFTTEHSSLYETHPFAGQFLFKDLQSNLFFIIDCRSLGLGSCLLLCIPEIQ